MALSLNDIHAILHLPGKSKRIIDELAFDSRRIVDAQATLFIALEGKRDGHDFIADAYEAGVRAFLVQRDKQPNLPQDATVLAVQKPLDALQTIAQYLREQRKGLTIGITGSNGKTVVKEWLYHVLKELYNLGRSPKSYNSQLGVALSLWQIPKQTDIDILEAGISKPGEMEKLAPLIQADLGILTSFGSAHDEGFSSKTEKLREKLKLFERAQALIFPAHETWLLKEVKDWAKGKTIELLPWQNKYESEAGYISISSDSTVGTLHFSGTELSIPFSDKASLENACTCLMVLQYLRKNIKQCADDFLTLPSIDMRLQLRSGKKDSKVINDAYSADLNSLEIALDFLEKQAGKSPRVLVLSDLKESGKTGLELMKELAKLLKKHPIDLFIGVGDELTELSPELGKTRQYYRSTQELEPLLLGLLPEHATALIKGGREFGFERLSRILEDRVHETALEIDLQALEHNFSFFRKKLKKKSKIMAMVKAYAYGSGSYEIAQTLQNAGADYLAVAYADEGIELRKKGVSLPIMVMNPQRDNLEALLDYNLEADIYDFEILQKLIDTLNETGIPEAQIHLEFDTGMHRLGFRKEDLSRLFAILEKNPGLQIKSVFAHLAAGDAKEHDAFTWQQLADFQELKNQVITFLKYKPLFHILNTAGTSRFTEAQHEMVRLGIGLYGIDPSETYQKELIPVATFSARISQIRSLEAGTTVGYSRMGKLERDSEIAVISLGYADGFRRELSNGKGHVWINGQLAPVVGNVCMDMTMVDVTDVNCKVGDSVELFGTHRPIAQLANECATIPYEILTSISGRVKRVYWKE